MRVDYDKELLSSLIRKAGGNLHLVEKALARASLAKKSAYVTGAEVEAAIRTLRQEADTQALRPTDTISEN